MISDQNAGNILFLGVARSNDRTLIASYVSSKYDPNLSSYQNSANEVLSAPDFQSKVTQGSRYRLVGELNAFNFTVDGSLVFICITSLQYPERLVFTLLNDLAPKFKANLGSSAETSLAGGLDKKAQNMFSATVKEYNDPTKKDKLSSVMSKVEDVKLTMHNNIDGMLRNLDQTEQVEQTTAKLHEQARLFDNQARTIKRQEQWKNMKLTIMIGGIFVFMVILLVLLNS